MWRAEDRLIDTTQSNWEKLQNIIRRGQVRDLMTDARCNLATLRRHFATAVHAEPTIPAAFTQACRDYLATLALDGTPLFIESGVQGTFPLFLLSLSGNRGEMVFYTTTPWLYPTYEPIVFRNEVISI